MKHTIHYKEYYDHPGRPGMVGGSMARGNAPYEIIDASDLVDGKYDICAVCIRGANKGKILAGSNDLNQLGHEDMLHESGLATKTGEIDNWVRFVVNKGMLNGSLIYAASDFDPYTQADDEEGYMDSMSNIYDACDILTKRGLPPTTRLVIETVPGEEDLNIRVGKQLKHYTIRVKEYYNHPGRPGQVGGSLPKNIPADFSAPNQQALNDFIQEGNVPYDDDYIVNLGGTYYKISTESWFPGCLEGRDGDWGETNRENIKDNYKNIMADEHNIPRPDIYGYVDNADGTEFGITYIGKIINSESKHYTIRVKDFPGHAGRPGEVGGSMPKGGGASDEEPKPKSKRAAKVKFDGLKEIIMSSDSPDVSEAEREALKETIKGDYEVYRGIGCIKAYFSGDQWGSLKTLRPGDEVPPLLQRGGNKEHDERVGHNTTASYTKSLANAQHYSEGTIRIVVKATPSHSNIIADLANIPKIPNIAKHFSAEDLAYMKMEREVLVQEPTKATIVSIIIDGRKYT